MKNIHKLAVAALLAASTSLTLAQNLWTGGGASQNWSDASNWDLGAPLATDILYFEDSLYTGWTNQAKVVNNIVNANTSVGSANYTAVSYFSVGNHFFTTLIPGGVALTLGGLGSTPQASLAVGDIPGETGWFNTSGPTNYATFTGTGSLVVNDTASLISVGMRNRATLDLGDLNTFSANVKQLWVGVSDNNPNTSGPVGWLLLAKTNTITTPANPAVPGILVGHATNSTPGSSTVLLGEINSINTDGFTIGGRRSGFGTTMGFAVPGTLTLRGSAGGSTPVSVLSIGDASANPDGYGTSFVGTSSTAYTAAAGTADFSGGTVDILADSLYIGRAVDTAFTTQGGTGNGTFIAGAGTISATNVFIGYQPPTVSQNKAYGVLTLQGTAVMDVANDVSLIFRTNGTSFISEGKVNVNDSAALNIGGDLITTMTVGSWTPASVNLGGGTINMTGGGAVSVPRILGAGYLTNASSITVTNELTPGTAILPGTLFLGNNLTVGAAIKPFFNLGANTTVGGGVNDYIEVANDVTFNSNPLTLDFTAPPVVGTYKLFGYGGTQTGSVTWANPTRFPIGLVQGSGQVAIVVTNLTPATLVWQATGASAAWDKTALTWNGNTEKFFDWDHVRFDDTGVATNVTISGITNFPSSVTVSNNTKDYIFTQSSNGRFSGFGSLTKQGTGTLSMGAGGTANEFTGPVNINGGTIRVASFNSGVFGTAASTDPVTIAAGASLDCFGNSVGSSSYINRSYVIAGDGPDGNGAIVHSNPTGSANPSITTSGLTLSANASFGVVATKALNISGSSAPYSGVLDLAGNTLASRGAGESRIVQMVGTNAGNIVVEGAVLAIRNSIIEGAGTISVGNNMLSLGGNGAFTTGYVAKAISVTNGTIEARNINAASIPLMSPIGIATGGSLTITNRQEIVASGIISGNGSLTKVGTSNLVLTAANTYSGATVVNEGALVLGTTGTLTSPSITVNSGAALDVTAKAGGYTVPSGQTVVVQGAAYGNLVAGAGGTLRGGGTLGASVSVSPGGTLAVGTSVSSGTLTVVSNLTFNGGTNVIKLGGPDDLVAVGGDLSFTAPTVIRVVPVGALGTHTLFTYAGTLSGTNNIQFTAPRPLVFVLDTTTPGVVAVNITGGVTVDWNGGYVGAPTAWDVDTSTNWLNASNPDVFFGGDAVTFGDSALTNLVSLAATVQPASVTFNNSSAAYTLTGAGGITAGSLTTSGGANVTLGNNGNVTLTGTGLALNAGTLTFNQASNATLTAKITGFAGLAKSGSSTLTVVSSDSTNYNGTVAVNSGTLRSGSLQALGSSSVTVNGGTLDVNGQVNTLASVSASGTGAGGQGAVNNSGAQQTNAVSSLTLNGNTTLGASSNRWDVAGIFTGNDHNLTKVGASDLWIKSGADTGLGNIDVAAGRLIFANSGTLLGSTSSNIVVRTNAVLGFASGVQAPGKSMLIENGGSLYSTGSTNLFGGSIVMSNGLVRFDPNSLLELSGNLSGPAKLTVQGVNAGNFGTLTLSGSNTYTGGTLVNDGELVIAGSNSIPANTNIVLSSRVTYNNSGHPSVSIVSNVVTPVGVTLEMQTVGSAGAAQASLSGDGGTWAGPILLTGNSPNCRANFSAGLNGLVINGAVNGSGFLGGGGVHIGGDACDTVTLVGEGVRFNSSLVFTGNLVQSQFGGSFGSPQMPKLFLGAAGNSWTNTSFYRGLIQIGAHNALPLQTMTVGHPFGGDHRFILDLNGYNQTVSDLRHTLLPGNDPIWLGNSSTNADSVLTYAGTGSNTWAAFIVDAFDTNAVVQKKTSLTVASGYLRLMNQGYWTNEFANPYAPSGPVADVYTGPTAVTGGTLQVDTTIHNSPVTVNGTGTLMGTGTLGAGVTVAAGGTLAPGASIGTLTVNNNLSLGGTCAVEINATTGTNDMVVGVNTLTYGGALNIANQSGTLAPGNTFTLFSASSYGGAFASINTQSAGQLVTWNTNNLAVNGSITVASVTSSTTPTITNSISGNQFTMTWPAANIGWQLQTQTNTLSTGISPAAPWYPVGGSASTNSVTVTISPSTPTVFFRLVYP